MVSGTDSGVTSGVGWAAAEDAALAAKLDVASLLAGCLPVTSAAEASTHASITARRALSQCGPLLAMTRGSNSIELVRPPDETRCLDKNLDAAGLMGRPSGSTGGVRVTSLVGMLIGMRYRCCKALECQLRVTALFHSRSPASQVADATESPFSAGVCGLGERLVNILGRDKAPWPSGRCHGVVERLTQQVAIS